MKLVTSSHTPLIELLSRFHKKTDAMVFLLFSFFSPAGCIITSFSHGGFPNVEKIESDKIIKLTLGRFPMRKCCSAGKINWSDYKCLVFIVSINWRE